VVWSLTDVPIVPRLYPLERTHVLVEIIPPSIMGEDLVGVLKSQSIQSGCHGNKAIFLTQENVDFRFFVYRDREKRDVIVEVQRRSGNSFNFYQHVRAILNATQCKAILKDEIPPYLQDYNYCRVTSLDFASNLLDSPATMNLALQALESLPSTMGSSTANQVASLLFKGESDVACKLIDLIKTEQCKARILSVLGNALSRCETTHDNSELLG
jgi:hypothetical protein